MSNMSSPATASPSDFTPRPTYSPLPEELHHPPTGPYGKYHPDNYKNQAPYLKNPPVSAISTLSIPSGPKRSSTHQRRPSDVQRRLKLYQREMAMTAQRAGGALSATSRHAQQEPQSPKLKPLGSTGPITPFQLDLSSDALAGYVVAGARRPRGLTERDIVTDVIRSEEARRMARDQIHSKGVR